MNILLVSVDVFPQMGGISMMTHHLANAFVEVGHSVVVMGPKGAYVPSEFGREYHLLEDFESYVQRRGGAEAETEDQRLRPLFKAVLSNYAIDRALLMHPFYYSIPLLDVCADMGVPVSAYIHGYELRSQTRGKAPANHPELVRKRKISTLRERVFYTLGAADEVLVNSSYTATLLSPFEGVKRSRVTGCGIPELLLSREQAFSPRYSSEQRSERRRQLGLPDLTTMAFVGRLVATKRADRLLELCQQEPNLAAVLIGDGPEARVIERRAVEMKIERRVRVLGTVTEEEKWTYLRASDFCCLLSEPDDEKGQVEGFGITLLESAAAGAVPVSSGTGGMVDVVRDLVDGVVLPPTEPDAGRRLAEIAGDPELMSRLVDAARAQIRARYNWRSVALRIAGGWQTSRVRG